MWLIIVLICYVDVDTRHPEVVHAVDDAATVEAQFVDDSVEATAQHVDDAVTAAPATVDQIRKF